MESRFAGKLFAFSFLIHIFLAANFVSVRPAILHPSALAPFPKPHTCR